MVFIAFLRYSDLFTYQSVSKAQFLLDVFIIIFAYAYTKIEQDSLANDIVLLVHVCLLY